ncbi:MAG: ABC transporter permease [Eubacterium sp.]|nr:ABC transporter permease [Eubacterium sp.]
MFKNFGKVFQFTFHNQVSQKGFKALTIGIGIFLFVLPIVILLILSMNAKNESEKKLESCGADKIYVVNEAGNVSDYSLLKNVDGDGYADITYVSAATVDEALDTIKSAGEKRSFVLLVTKDENEEIDASIILPDDTSIEKSKAKNYNDAIKKMNMMFIVVCRGISIQDMTEFSKTIKTDAFDVAGWKSGTSLYTDKGKAEEQNNEKIKEVFSLIITMLVCMIMYFVVLAYGASITKNIVMEKTSKLMDTLLISVKPEALIFGKLLGVLTAGLMQFFIWIGLLVGGVVAGVVLSDVFFPNADASVIVFLKNMGSLNLFQPVPVILAVVVLIFGILLYASLAAFAGAISNTMEQAASNQSIFILILIASYFIVMIKGLDINAAATWMFLCPFTAALILPTGLLLGTISMSTALIGVALLVVLALALVIFAGHVYKAMALYKGTDGGLRKVFKIISTK